MTLFEIRHRVERTAHRSAHVLHFAYLGAVGIEAHGSYRWCAVALLIALVVDAACRGELE